MKRDQIQALCDRLRTVPSTQDLEDAAKMLEDAYLGIAVAEASYRMQVETNKMRELLNNMATELRTLRLILEDDA